MEFSDGILVDRNPFHLHSRPGRLFNEAKIKYDRDSRLGLGRDISNMILSLAKEGSAWGGELARRINAGQPNVSRYLRRLEDLHLVKIMEDLRAVRSGNRNGGGKPAVVWGLTERGRDLAKAMDEWSLGKWTGMPSEMDEAVRVECQTPAGQLQDTWTVTRHLSGIPSP